MQSMTALILCGGLGTRLRSVVGSLPKALAPIAGRPFLDYQLHYLRRQGVREVVLCTGYGADAVRGHCGAGSTWDLGVRYSVETEPRGTGGAVKLAEALVGAGPFLVLNGDSFAAADLGSLVAFHRRRGAALTLALAQVPDRQRFGAVTVNAEGAVTAYGEKGLSGPGLINAGVYVMERVVLEAMPAGRAVSLEQDVFPSWIGRGLDGFAAPGPFLDIGTAETYAQAEAFLATWPWGRLPEPASPVA
jgi:NDP-sugar pyrophosphorylase family protein